eukprot:601035_1
MEPRCRHHSFLPSIDAHHRPQRSARFKYGIVQLCHTESKYAIIDTEPLKEEYQSRRSGGGGGGASVEKKDAEHVEKIMRSMRTMLHTVISKNQVNGQGV